MTDYKKQFEDLLKNSKKIAITAHMGPDPDSIFSCTALNYYLNKYKELNSTIVYEGTSTDWIDRVEMSDEIKWVDEVADVIDEYDTWIFLDGSEMARFSRLDLTERIKDKITICLDHHPAPPDLDFDMYYKDTAMAGVAHLIGEYIIDFDVLEKDRLLTELVLAGILGDTGELKFVSKNWATVLSFIQKLVEVHDFQIDEISKRFTTQSKNDLIIIQEMLKNTSYSTHRDGEKFMYSFLTKEFIEQNKLSIADVMSGKSSYLSKFVRMVHNYEFGFILVPTKSHYGLSFRSSNNVVDVRKLALKFNGGGHTLAAGGQIEGDEAKNVHEALEIVLKVLNETTLEKP
jgi:bifunctional oligoribonuclease and PAP phosphatase NrnA